MVIGEQAESRLGVELTHLKFYEGDLRDKGYMYPNNYRARLEQEATRYVNIELCLHNLLYEQRDQKFQLLVRYYNPDGSLAWEDRREEALPSGDEDFYETTGCGWREPGKWANGTYQTEIFIDGVKIAEKPFSIFHRIDITMDMFGWSVAHLGWAKGEYNEETRHKVLDTDFVESIEACTLTTSPTTAVTCKDMMVYILFGTPEEIKRKLHLQE